MPTQSTDTNNLTFAAANQQWIVSQGVVIATTAENADAVNIGVSGAQLFNHGDLSATGGGVFGSSGVHVGSNGQSAFVFNGNTGSILANQAIYTQASGTTLFNDGTIIGLETNGVKFEIFSGGHEIRNDGYLFGETAAIFGSAVNGDVKIVNTGELDSNGIGISLDLATESIVKILNSGLINSESVAITTKGIGRTELVNGGEIAGDVVLEDVFHDDKVRNYGLIDGNVLMGGSVDVYNGKKGAVSGIIKGGSGDDTLKGGGEVDELLGGRGEDKIKGRGGDDILDGGARGDNLTGGSGKNTFLYEDVEDSQGGFFASTMRDVIFDFGHGKGDKIDLSPIEAKSGGGKFTFIGNDAFTGKKGELRYHVDSGDSYVQADVNGDRKADMEIKLKDVTKLGAEDFNL